METLIIISLIIAGLLMFIVEVFLIPGISIAGIASAISFIYAIYYAFAHSGVQIGFITIGVVAITVLCVVIWFMKSKTVDRLALNKTLDYKPDPLKGLDIKEGDSGISLTRLTLIGKAEIKGHIIEVQSSDGFIDEKTPIQVSRIIDGTVYVQPLKQ